MNDLNFVWVKYTGIACVIRSSLFSIFQAWPCGYLKERVRVHTSSDELILHTPKLKYSYSICTKERHISLPSTRWYVKIEVQKAFDAVSRGNYYWTSYAWRRSPLLAGSEINHGRYGLRVAYSFSDFVVWRHQMSLGCIDQNGWHQTYFCCVFYGTIPIYS